jgi:hypothetical protein
MNFDLNINNYTKDELYEMFELPLNSDISSMLSMFEKKVSQLIINIMKNKEISKEIQTKTLDFIKKAKQTLFDKDTISTITKEFASLTNRNNELQQTTLDNSNEHLVQVRNKKPSINSFVKEYTEGIINPIRKSKSDLYLNIDTRFRENYYSTSPSNINIVLPMLINNVLIMRLASIEIPLSSLFNVSKQLGNNFFIVTLTDTNESAVVDIPNGNYDYSGLADSINKKLSLLGGNFAKIVFIINNVTNNGSGQTMVGCAENSSFNFELNFQADRFGNDDKNTPLPLKFGWTLGFRNGIYTNNQNYVSEGAVDLKGQKYLYLVVDDYNNNVNNNFYSAFNSSILNKNILARITIQNNVSNVTISQIREYYGPVNIQNLTIQLLDGYGRIVDLNNMDYSFCLAMQKVYDI